MQVDYVLIGEDLFHACFNTFAEDWFHFMTIADDLFHSLIFCTLLKIN